MKPFEEYSVPATFEKPDRNAIAKKFKDEIDSAKMTAEERRVALDGLRDRISSHMKEVMKPYEELKASLHREFWEHCREEFGYEKILNQPAIDALERKAWEEGHSGGYQEVYNILDDLNDLIQTVAKNLKTK